jgi:uncharacterized protein YqfA (UPF0365 family)
MLLMGYYSLDPLGKGFFRVDPAITLPPEALAFYSETTSFRAAGVGKVIKQIISTTTERASKKVIAEVSEGTVEAVGKETVEKTALESSTEASEQIAKEYPELAAKAARNETGAKGRFQNLVNQRSRKLFDEKIVAKETGENVVETTTKTVAKKEARETAVERYAKFATSKGLFYGTAFAILKVPAEALADVIGDTADSFLGNDCDRADTEEKYPDESSEQIDARMEACEAEGFKRTMLLGAAGLGIVGILGAVIVTRLFPKKTKVPEATQ